MKKPSSFVTAALLAAVAATSIGLAIPATAQDGSGPARGENRAARLFEQFDTNGDGQITEAEIAAAREARFAEADTDGDGQLSVDELAAQAEARQADRMERRAARMLERLDTDGNGFVSAEEMASIGEGRRGGSMFDRLDANDDGVVTEEEVAELGGRGHGKRFGGHGGRGHD